MIGLLLMFLVMAVIIAGLFFHPLWWSLMLLIPVWYVVGEEL